MWPWYHEKRSVFKCQNVLKNKIILPGLFSDGYPCVTKIFNNKNEKILRLGCNFMFTVSSTDVSNMLCYASVDSFESTVCNITSTRPRTSQLYLKLNWRQQLHAAIFYVGNFQTSGLHKLIHQSEERSRSCDLIARLWLVDCWWSCQDQLIGTSYDTMMTGVTPGSTRGRMLPLVQPDEHWVLSDLFYWINMWREEKYIFTMFIQWTRRILLICCYWSKIGSFIIVCVSI